MRVVGLAENKATQPSLAGACAELGKILSQNVIVIAKNMEKPVKRQLKCTLGFLYIHISDGQTSLHFTLNKIPLKYKNHIKHKRICKLRIK